MSAEPSANASALVTLDRMALLERDTYLAELTAVLRDATAGQGSVVLLTGEAGAGKTSLVREFTAAQDQARVLWGLCDELVTPRPLGPFRDMFNWLAADAAPGAVTDLLGALVDELGRTPQATVAVVEDAQWADRATLDAIRFIGRRIARLPAVLIVTYRTDEVPPGHALRVALGAIPSSVVRRLRLPPLSIDAVAQLAGRSDVAELYELTGGNPFYVNEVLAAPGVSVPLTVQDAVMARVGRLSAAGRAAVELAATIPGSAATWLLDECGAAAAGVEEAVSEGVLRRDGEVVAFPHELTRRAVRQSVPAPRWRQINADVLDVLVAHDADPARLTHHAVEAERVEAVVAYAPVAARRALGLESFAEAFDHFGQALEHAEHYTDADLIDLLEGYSRAAWPVGRWDDAVAAISRAVELCAQAGDRHRQARNLCTLSEIAWSTGRAEQAHRAVDQAIRLLEGEPATDSLVDAYAHRARLAMVDFRHSAAVEWSERAIRLARDAGLRPPIHARVTLGAARLQAGDEHELVAALESALKAGDIHAAARAYVNLADLLSLNQRYAEARRYIDEGLKLLEAHDMIGGIDHMVGVRARWHLEQGHWSEVETDAESLPGMEGTGVTMAETALGRVRARRGDPRAAATLEAARRGADNGRDTQLVVPAVLAQAELAWLAGDPAGAAGAVASVAERIHRTAMPRWLGEAALWRHRAGERGDVPAGAAEPYVRQIRGDWAGAARCWERLGRPYEQADALADATEPEPVLRALEILDRLGAVPRATMVRERLAQLGVASVPRGPRSTTRANPGRLTVRQTEVLELLGEELTYQQIAERLQLSIKTVDHHVAAIRVKLGVASRDDAVAAARRLGILM